jgi:hypothetical protein
LDEKNIKIRYKKKYLMEQNKQTESPKKERDGVAVWGARILVISIFSFIASSPLWIAYYLFSAIICINEKEWWCFGIKGCSIIGLLVFLLFFYKLVLRKPRKQ